MRPIGFSTGALALDDFNHALNMLRKNTKIKNIELSALRVNELDIFVDAISKLDLTQFTYISFHAPSRFDPKKEQEIVQKLHALNKPEWPIILHPDVITNFSLWQKFGSSLCLENMDKRKKFGRSVSELVGLFDKLPDASFCFDIGHARQVDTSMTEAYLLIKAFRNRLKQVHLSEVTTSSKHDRLSYSAILAYQEIASFIPQEIPIILETPVEPDEMSNEIERALQALP